VEQHGSGESFSLNSLVFQLVIIPSMHHKHLLSSSTGPSTIGPLEATVPRNSTSHPQTKKKNLKELLYILVSY